MRIIRASRIPYRYEYNGYLIDCVGQSMFDVLDEDEELIEGTFDTRESAEEYIDNIINKAQRFASLRNKMYRYRNAQPEYIWSYKGAVTKDGNTLSNYVDVRVDAKSRQSAITKIKQKLSKKLNIPIALFDHIQITDNDVRREGLSSKIR